MIHIPRFNDLVIEPPRRSVGVAGVISLTKGKNLGYMDANTGVWVPGREVVTGKVDPFCNIITNTGLDALAGYTADDASSYCHVGTGTATEAATDTALGTHVAYEATAYSKSDSAKSSAPYYGYLNRAWRFGEGEAEGNIAEIGFNNSASNANMFSRARVKDGGGSPTTITVLSDEYLDVSYQLRLYPDHINSDGSTNDGTGSIDISGTSYSYTIRPAYVNNNTYYDAELMRAYVSLVKPWILYSSDAALGAVTSTLSASQTDSIGAGYFNNTYSAGTYTRGVGVTVGLGEGNLSGGVAGILAFTYMGAYQMLLASAIPKDNTKILTLNLDLSWTRATIS